MALLYQLGLALLLVTIGPLLLLVRSRHYATTVRGRLTAALPASPPGALWLHAVSVGEVAVSAVIAPALPAEMPLLVTTITPTGQARARTLFAGRAAVGYLPFDLGVTVERFLRRLRPAALVLVEGDYWPLVLARCRRRGMPIAVVNGRVGDRTLRLLSGRPRLAHWLLGAVDRFAVQTSEDARRLQVLGVDPERVSVAGNLKYEAAEPPPQPRLEGALLGLAAGRPLLLAGSTMAGEEAAVLAAHAALGGGERALLVLAPRHPERWDEVARLLDGAGVAWVRRTVLREASQAASPDPEALQWQGAPPPDLASRTGDPLPQRASPPALASRQGSEGRPTAVVLLDSLGELAALYRLAAGCFVGGTLAGTGGHNPLEPARFARAIAVGPSMQNFRDVAAQFDRAQAWRRVASSEELAAAWGDWLEAPEQARLLGERALQVVDANRGALERTLAVLAPLLARVGSVAGQPTATAAAPVATAPNAPVAPTSRPDTRSRPDAMEMLPPELPPERAPR